MCKFERVNSSAVLSVIVLDFVLNQCCIYKSKYERMAKSD
jgi:hypothetical protein